MKIRNIFFLSSFLLIHALSLCAKTYEGKIIDRIGFIGLKQISVNELNALTSYYTGKPYTGDLFNELQGSLYSLNYFEGIIQPDFQEIPDNKLLIIFSVKEKPFIISIGYKGNTVFWEDDLNKALSFSKGDPYENSLVLLGEEDIKKMYVKKGYLDAKVSSKVDFSSDGTKIVYSIDSGQRSTVVKVIFEGVTKFSENRLKRQLVSRIEGLFSDGSFKEENLPLDAKSLEKYYQDNGYLDAKVLSSSFEINENISKKRKEVTLNFSINEGEVYEYSGMSFIGNKVFSNEELQSFLRHPIGIFRKDKLEEDIASIQKVYADRGYVFNNYQAKMVIGKNNSISYILQITEGSQAHIGAIHIQGNKKTKKHVILREIPLEVGDFFNVEAFRLGLINLRDLRYFSNIVPDIQPDVDNLGLIDLNLQVQEQGSADIQLGLTFSASSESPFPVSFFAKWEERNFLGEGYTFGTGINFSTFEQSLNVSFQDNWFKGIPWFWQVGFKTGHSILTATQDVTGPIFEGKEEIPDPYESLEEYLNAKNTNNFNYMHYGLWENLVEGSTGYVFSTYLGRFSLSSGLSIGLNYVYYDSLKQRPSSYYLIDNLYKFRFENTLQFKTSWDTRDYFIAPQSGFRLSQSIGFTGGFLLGQVHFTKLSTSFENYWKFFDWAPYGENKWHWKLILKTEANYSTLIAPLGNNFELEAPPKHHLFMSESFGKGRGWGIDKDMYSLALANLTVSMPLVESIFWWDILFFDAFVSSKDPKTSSLTKGLSFYRFSVGTQLRSVIQQLPLALGIVKPFYFNEKGEYREKNEIAPSLWNGWGLVVSLYINI